MAETRKYQPSTNAVGDAIRAALGEPVRPVQPGGKPAPSSEPAEQAASPAPAVVTRTFTFGGARPAAAPSDADE